MLELVVKSEELFDEATEEFIDAAEPVTLHLEHSLISLSKWEAFYKKPFLAKEDKSNEELLWYVKAMSLDSDVAPEVFSRLRAEHYDEINKYINDTQTATWFTEIPGTNKPNSEVITAELIYYWMIAFTIPVEFERWHLTRLLTLIRVCNNKNSKPKKMSKAEAAAQQRQLNEQRLKEWGTTG